MKIFVDKLDKSGVVVDGYDYNLQAWIKDGVIQDCFHPEHWKESHCCNAHRLAGRRIHETPGHERRYGSIGIAV